MCEMCAACSENSNEVVGCVHDCVHWVTQTHRCTAAQHSLLTTVRARHSDISRMPRQGQQELTKLIAASLVTKCWQFSGWWMMGYKCMEQAN